ncbi:MAG: hypothetical protein ACPIG7_07440 [Akkermansiaceae bacterium]|jgi:hypothetical protein
MNKKTFLVTAIIGFLFVGGVAFGFYTMKMNANSFRGIAIPVKGLPPELCEKWESAFQEVLSEEAVLQEIVDETDYSEKLDVQAEEAVTHLKDAIKVRFVKRKDSIEIGLVGKRKQNEDLTKIAEYLYRRSTEDVAKKEPSFLQYLAAKEQAAGQPPLE